MIAHHHTVDPGGLGRDGEVDEVVQRRESVASVQFSDSTISARSDVIVILPHRSHLDSTQPTRRGAKSSTSPAADSRATSPTRRRWGPERAAVRGATAPPAPISSECEKDSTTPSDAVAPTTRPVPKGRQRLVVQRVDVERPPDHLGDEREGTTTHRVRGLAPVDFPLRVSGTVVEFDVLVQRPAVGDVDQLETSTDRQHRDSLGARGGVEGEFPLVAIGFDLVPVRSWGVGVVVRGVRRRRRRSGPVRRGATRSRQRRRHASVRRALRRPGRPIGRSRRSAGQRTIPTSPAGTNVPSRDAGQRRPDRPIKGRIRQFYARGTPETCYKSFGHKQPIDVTFWGTRLMENFVDDS